MKGNETLFDKAHVNLKTAILLFNNIESDEMFINIVGYHLQQAGELYVKNLLEISGVKYPKTHDIIELIDLFEDNFGEDSNENISKLRVYGDSLTKWESKTRYIKNYKASLRQVKECLYVLESIFNDYKNQNKLNKTNNF